MNERTLIKQSEKSRISNNAAKQLNKDKRANSCNSCGVCSRLRSPQISPETASLAILEAKALGKESCAVSFMQRNYGNRSTANVLHQTIQKKCSCGSSCPRCKGEEEAERVSMSIMKMEKSSQVSKLPSDQVAQPIQLLGSSDTCKLGYSDQAQISEIMSNKGSGHGLDDNTRSFMEERFGHDFSSVRLHTDSYAARKSNDLNAEAFTIGRDVFFNTGRYEPTSTGRKRLLAHELTHVVQQNTVMSSPVVQRLSDPDCGRARGLLRFSDSCPNYNNTCYSSSFTAASGTTVTINVTVTYHNPSECSFTEGKEDFRVQLKQCGWIDTVVRDFGTGNIGTMLTGTATLPGAGWFLGNNNYYLRVYSRSNCRLTASMSVR